MVCPRNRTSSAWDMAWCRWFGTMAGRCLLWLLRLAISLTGTVSTYVRSFVATGPVPQVYDPPYGQALTCIPLVWCGVAAWCGRCGGVAWWVHDIESFIVPSSSLHPSLLTTIHHLHPRGTGRRPVQWSSCRTTSASPSSRPRSTPRMWRGWCCGPQWRASSGSPSGTPTVSPRKQSTIPLDQAPPDQAPRSWL